MRRLLLLAALAAPVLQSPFPLRAQLRVTKDRPAAPGAADARASRRAAPERPTLVLFLTVDQMRGDYFERFGPELTGGLARLARSGALWTRALHDHANTETAPGHAATLSGRYPVHTGINSNARGVNTTEAPLVAGGTGPGASPFRFRGTTLFDWMKAADPRTRALSVSRKDRGAILPIGASKEATVVWYSVPGLFTTSRYYADTLPAWLTAFNAEQRPRRYAGTSWELVRPASAYPEPDSVAVEAGGKDFTFPHRLPADSAEAARALVEYPFMDELTLAAAWRGFRAMELGAGPQTDLLAISLSTTDAIGHRWGPDSRELHDQILRLDRALGVFLDSLYAARDSTRILVALTSDHGIQPIHGLPAPGKAAADRKVMSVLDVSRRLTDFLRARGAPTNAATVSTEGLEVDEALLRAARIPVDSLVDGVAAELRGLPGFLRVDRVAALAADSARDPIARRWLRMYTVDGPQKVVITPEPYAVWGGPYQKSAQHGSPHDYDTVVPILFAGPGIRPARHRGTIRVVDIAPTLAALLGVAPLERVDGTAVREIVPPSARSGDAAAR